jgi:hypothetical protein
MQQNLQQNTVKITILIDGPLWLINKKNLGSNKILDKLRRWAGKQRTRTLSKKWRFEVLLRHPGKCYFAMPPEGFKIKHNEVNEMNAT